MYVSAIVLAAGRGLRFKSKVSKPLITINAKPVISYSLNTLNRHPLIKDIIIVVNSLNQRGIASEIKRYNTTKSRAIILGGEERQDSVQNGLKAIDPRTDLILIHDAARPFISPKDISLVIKQAGKSGAAILGVPVKATIKRVTENGLRETGKKNRFGTHIIVSETLNRNSLWEIQTPQVFKKDLILKAHEKFAGVKVTDDAMLVEKLGVKVNVVLGSYNNIKITTPEDLILAEAIERSLKL
ncbi:MAG: 2-C-methyl-D-erythritol 4-phosphate cytidylyltransferase [Candidatus Omnitrophota bacterium]